MSKSIHTLFLTCLFATRALADSGPQIPCDGCDHAHFSEPTSGLWHNPERPGSGMTIQMQSGLLLGGLYTYEPDGSAQWYTFAGSPEALEGPPHSLRLRAPLLRYEGGACVACDYTAPSVIEDGGEIVLEFTQRNYGSYFIDRGVSDTQKHFIVPLVLGIGGGQDFADVEYELPELGGMWAFAFTNPDEDPRNGTHSEVVALSNKAVRRDSAGNVTRVEYFMNQCTQNCFEVLIVGKITCDLSVDQTATPRPICSLSASLSLPWTGVSSPQSAPLPIANIGADRIEVVDSESGLRVKAFRIEYD